MFPRQGPIAERSEGSHAVDRLRLHGPVQRSWFRLGAEDLVELARHRKQNGIDVDLNSIIETTVSISRNEWKYVADLDLDLMEDLPLVRCREGEMKQVILNMVVNAAHAIGASVEGGAKGRITVATRVVGDIAQISIRDNGTGMPPEVRERIFDQFFTTKDVGKGTGQGLSLAWDVVRGHEGTIEVMSEVGEGTTFHINLPLHMELVAPGSDPTGISETS